MNKINTLIFAIIINLNNYLSVEQSQSTLQPQDIENINLQKNRELDKNIPLKIIEEQNKELINRKKEFHLLKEKLQINKQKYQSELQNLKQHNEELTVSFHNKVLENYQLKAQQEEEVHNKQIKINFLENQIIKNKKQRKELKQEFRSLDLQKNQELQQLKENLQIRWNNSEKQKLELEKLEEKFKSLHVEKDQELERLKEKFEIAYRNSKKQTLELEDLKQENKELKKFHKKRFSMVLEIGKQDDFIKDQESKINSLHYKLLLANHKRENIVYEYKLLDLLFNYKLLDLQKDQKLKELEKDQELNELEKTVIVDENSHLLKQNLKEDLLKEKLLNKQKYELQLEDLKLNRPLTIQPYEEYLSQIFQKKEEKRKKSLEKIDNILK